MMTTPRKWRLFLCVFVAFFARDNGLVTTTKIRASPFQRRVVISDPQSEGISQLPLKQVTYESARRALRAQKSSPLACVALLRDIGKELELNEHLCAFALDSCAQKGHMPLALQVFDMVDNPTALSYCILVKGYGRRADIARHDSERDECARAVQGVVEDMKRRKAATDAIFDNALVDAYVRCGRVDLATSALRESTTRPNAKRYNAVLKGLAREGEARAAISLVREMTRVGVKPTEVTDATLAHGLAVVGKPGLAEKFLRRRDRWEDARQGTAAFTAVLKGYERKPVRAFKLLEFMKRIDVPRNEVTYEHLLAACAGDRRLLDVAWRAMKLESRWVFPSSVTYNTAIAGYLQADEVKKAFDLTKEALAAGLMTSNTLNTLLDLLLSKGNSIDPEIEKIALSMFSKSRFPPEHSNFPSATAATYSIVIRYFGRKRQLEKVKASWRAALESKKVDVVAANTYLDALTRCDDIRSALQLLGEMADLAQPCSPDVVSYATVVSALSRSSNDYAGDRAIKIYEQAASTLRPDARLVKAALAACVSLTGSRRSVFDGDGHNDPAVHAAEIILARDLAHLSPEDRTDLRAFAASTVFGPSKNEAWKDRRRKDDTFINNRAWNSFNSGFRIL